MGIEPMGAIERVPILVEKRLWRPMKSDNGEAEGPKLALEAAVAATQQNTN